MKKHQPSKSFVMREISRRIKAERWRRAIEVPPEHDTLLELNEQRRLLEKRIEKKLNRVRQHMPDQHAVTRLRAKIRRIERHREKAQREFKERLQKLNAIVSLKGVTRWAVQEFMRLFKIEEPKQ